jgi:hypothetical protein
MLLANSTTENAKVSFYPCPDINKIDVNDKCVSCWDKFKEEGLDTDNLDEIGKKLIVVHENDKVTNKYSCATHKGCLKEWLKVNPICPNCRSPVNFDSVFTQVEINEESRKKCVKKLQSTTKKCVKEVQLITIDGVKGGIHTTVVITGLFTAFIGMAILGSGNISEATSQFINGLSVEKTQQTALLLLNQISTAGALAHAGVRFVRRRGWLFTRIPL